MDLYRKARPWRSRPLTPAPGPTLATLWDRLENDREIARRILRLVEAALRDPTDGIGKPEPLKHLGPGLWSRRITREHRLVYLVREDRVDFLQARYPQLGLFPPPPASSERDEAEASSDGQESLEIETV